MHALFDSAAAASDPATAAKLRALSNLHSAKVHALMRSIHALRDEVGLLKAQAKEHRRSAQIELKEAHSKEVANWDMLLKDARASNEELKLVIESEKSAPEICFLKSVASIFVIVHRL